MTRQDKKNLIELFSENGKYFDPLLTNWRLLSLGEEK